MNCLLLSFDENGFQPLGIANTIPYIEAGGGIVTCIDLDISKLTTSQILREVQNNEIIFFSVPVYSAIEPTLECIRFLKKEKIDKPIIIYNQYASITPSIFYFYNTYVIIGDYVETIKNIIETYKSENFNICKYPNICSLEKKNATKKLSRELFLVPKRDELPPLNKYLKKNGKIVGNVETMHGCAHDCMYCSVYACYERNVIKIPLDVIKKDIENSILHGADHITFVDADMFSTGERFFEIAKWLKAVYNIPFDITIRLDDVLKYPEIFKNLKSLGCVEITSAVEFPKQQVLDSLKKGMTVEDIYNATENIKKYELELRPTFITYTPWIELEDFKLLDYYIENFKLEYDNLQKETRLLLYKGSPLLKHNDFFEKYSAEDKGHFYEWQHPSLEVDQLYNSTINLKQDIRRKRCCIKG